MNVPIKESDFPQYFKCGNKLLAFVAKDKMFKVEPIGSNMNPGVTIDHYITRNMVLRHYPTSGNKTELTKEQFSSLLKKLFDSYINKIVNY